MAGKKLSKSRICAGNSSPMSTVKAFGGTMSNIGTSVTGTIKGMVRRKK